MKVINNMEGTISVGDIVLRPGENKVDRESWEAVRGYFRKRLRDRQLIEVAEEPKSEPEPKKSKRSKKEDVAEDAE